MADLKTALSVVDEALAELPPQMASDRARVMMLAIGLQESRFTRTAQFSPGLPGDKGPARGWWQFERGGGVKGVLSHPAVADEAYRACRHRGVEPTDLRAVWLRIEGDQVLAAVFARLLLYSDPKPLPSIGEADAGWQAYLRNWRPGRPHRETWDRLYAQAVAAGAEASK